MPQKPAKAEKPKQQEKPKGKPTNVETASSEIKPLKIKGKVYTSSVHTMGEEEPDLKMSTESISASIEQEYNQLFDSRHSLPKNS